MRYYFHVWTEGLFASDSEGTDLADEAAAMAEARALAREFAIDDLMQPQHIAHRRIEITDGSGHAIATLRARDVLEGDEAAEAY